MVPIRLPFRLIVLLLLLSSDICLAVTSNQELRKGFSATPLSSVTPFQPILNDQFGNFSLGFLRLNRNQLALAVLHIASSEPLWFANPTHLASWSQSTLLFFNGSLVISDPETGFLWSTATNGNRVVLLNTSNLQVQKKNGESSSVIWQSFDFPTNTIVQDQNFTARMTLVSSNGLYSLRMGDDFMGLYAKYGGGSDELYWKRTPLEAKAEIVEGNGPIYARISSDGYLAMYQTGTKPVDVQMFNNFQRPNPLFLRVRIEPDGNLKGYCWDGSTWALNYQAIDEICELPNPCGSYGLCTPGAGCSCLYNGTSYSAGGCMKEGYGDLCGAGIGEDKYWVLRRRGVEPAHKELKRYERATSAEECEDMCETDCRCWGALYNNATGYCYVVEHPIQTMVGTGAESKVGYFKVRKDAGDQRKRVGMVVGIVGGVVVVVGVIGAGSYVMRKRRWRRGKGMVEEKEDRVISGPYKNLESASLRSIEMSNSH